MKPELKQKIKKIARVTVWFLLVIGLCATLGFASIEEGKMTGKALKISIKQNDENFFVDEQDIRQMLYDKGDSIINQPLNSIDISNLEKLMYANPWVSKAEVYMSIGGELKIELEQRKPLLRIINRNGESFYIDTEGKLMLWSQKFTPRVLISSGNIFESYNSFYHFSINDILDNDSLKKISCLDDLFAMAKYISGDEFWNAQTEQIFINHNCDMEFVGRVGNQKIIFGDANDMEEKFNKLKAFYKIGLNAVGWDNYDTLNLKYKNQVVAVKKKIELSDDLNGAGKSESKKGKKSELKKSEESKPNSSNSEKPKKKQKKSKSTQDKK